MSLNITVTPTGKGIPEDGLRGGGVDLDELGEELVVNGAAVSVRQLVPLARLDVHGDTVPREDAVST